jgi:4-amino-4-deoxy-L-arabinose transferase-like glycosyltransferase
MFPVLLGLAALVPPFDDELYYWCWSRDLQLSYYDHPPMVAYLIRLSTELFGDTILAIRLPGVLSGMG